MTGIEPEGTEIGNPAGFIAQAIGEGRSATETYNALVESGAGIRAEYFYQLYGQVSDALATEPAAMALDPFAIPDAQAYSTWSMGAGGEYVTSVRVWWREAGTDAIGTKLYDYKSTEPHTPMEAILAANQDYFSDDVTEPGGSGEDQVFLGATTHQVYTTTPWEG